MREIDEWAYQKLVEFVKKFAVGVFDESWYKLGKEAQELLKDIGEE